MYYVIQTPVYFKMLKECVKNEEYVEAFKTRAIEFRSFLVYGSNILAKNDKLMQSLRSNQNKYLLLYYNLTSQYIKLKNPTSRITAANQYL
jgi:hypothetical protein